LLGNFLEKNIYRQVYLCEKLYDLQEINIHEESKALEVCPGTIVNDLNEISVKIIDFIDVMYKKRNYFIVYFKEGTNITDIIQIIYSDSYFLKALSHFFEGDFSSLDLAEKDHISLSKAYKVKNNVLEFFDYYGYVVNNHICIPELDYRYMIIMLVSLTDWNGYRVRYGNIKSFSYKLINYVEKKLFNRKYTDFDKFLIYRGIEIGFIRCKKYSVTFLELDRENAKKKPLFKILSEGIEQLNCNIKMSENELLYIYSLFFSKYYLSNNVEHLLKDFEIAYNTIILKNQELFELKKILEIKFGTAIFESLVFKKCFINFARTLFGNVQQYIYTPIYILNNEQKIIKQRLLSCLDLWSKNNKDRYFNSNIIHELTIGISLIISNEYLDYYLDSLHVEKLAC